MKSMTEIPRVAVILLNFNQADHTRACIDSLRRVAYDNLEIVLIDNGSTDDSAAQLRKEFPDVIFVKNERNLGFGEGNNIGIRLALQREAQFVLLLNNDTIVERSFLHPLVELALKDKAIGAQSGKILYHSNPDLFWYAGGIIEKNKALPTHRGMLEKDKGQYDTIEETGFATGCLMFLSRTALEQVGDLDSSYFAYFEDSDWCLRARALGFRIIYNPRAKIWHKVSTTSTHDSPFYLYFNLRNKILFVRKHSTLTKIILRFPYFLYFYARQFIRLIFKWRNIPGTRAAWWGLVDGLRNFTGTYGMGRLLELRQRR